MMKEICRNDDNKLLRVEIFESFKKGNPNLLGQAEFSIKEIVIDNKKIYTVFDKRIVAGTLIVHKCHFLNRYTFLDYIHGGCDVSLMVGMDFTLSNKPAKDPKSLHYLDPAFHKETPNMFNSPQKMRLMGTGGNEGNSPGLRDGDLESKENEYMQALRKAINVLDYYDTDSFIPFFGFGAKLPPYFNTAS